MGVGMAKKKINMGFVAKNKFEDPRDSMVSAT